MRKEREALLVATLAGLVIVSAAAFVIQPSFASKATQTHTIASITQASSLAVAKAG